MTDKKTGYVTVILGIVVLVGLYLISLRNYLLFHSLAEIFSIVIAFCIFIIAWNSRRLMENSYLLFLGIAYLAVGGLDLIHTLAYSGMGVFVDRTTNLATQLWIATRYVESLSLLIAPVFLGRRLKIELILVGYAIASSIILASIFYWDIFPTCFVEGRGLTAFKKVSEYAISFMLVGAALALARRRQHFDQRVLHLLVGSIMVTIASELAFTFYIHAYGFSNLLGHFLKIVSFYLIYKALIETGLRQPYNLLFRDLKRREEALEKSERRYRAIFENTGTAMMIMEADGTISLVNTGFERLTGYSRSEVEWNRSWMDFVQEGRVWQLHDSAGAPRPDQNGAISGSELKIVDREGCVKDVHLTVGLIPGTEQAVASAVDITEQKQAQDIILRDKHTLAELVRQRTQDLVDAHQELSEAKRLSAIGTLAATVAHELRNPLGVIQTAIYNVGRKRKEPALDKHLANIEKKIAESNQIITNLLRYSRIKPPVRKQVNLLEIIKESMASAAERFPGQRVEINLGIGSLTDATLDLDVVQIREVFDNILNNAYHAVEELDGRIEVQVMTDPGRAISVSVTDNGTGMSPKDLEKVFEPFFTRKVRGTGLGLTICRELVQLHGGTIEAESQPGCGTTVTVRLPLGGVQ
jgi:PAS domain S-box-containing protein